MILGMIHDYSEKGFREVKRHGLDAIEFCLNWDVDSDAVLAQKEEIKSRSENYGIKVGAIGRWGMQRVDKNGEPLEEALHHDKNLIDLAVFLHCPVYNVGCNYTEGFSYYENCDFAIRYFRILLDYAKDKNVKIAVYNCDWRNFVYNEKAWSYILGALPELGIKFDSSHSINRNEDYLAVLRNWKERVYHVHIKGNLRIEGETYDDSPAGLDTTKWPAIMSLLYIANYDGMLSIEPHSHNWRGKKGDWGVAYTVQYMRPFVMPDDYCFEED